MDGPFQDITVTTLGTVMQPMPIPKFITIEWIGLLQNLNSTPLNWGIHNPTKFKFITPTIRQISRQISGAVAELALRDLKKEEKMKGKLKIKFITKELCNWDATPVYKYYVSE